MKAIVDFAFMIIKERGLKQPEHEKRAFDILTENGVISKELSERLQDAKGMRNIIAHEYGKIDDELVFEAITKEIMRDAKEFISSIRRLH